jgi:hypothetical protein
VGDDEIEGLGTGIEGAEIGGEKLDIPRPGGFGQLAGLENR